MKPSLVLGLLAACTLGCRHNERLAPVEFAAQEGAGDIDAEATLAPAWPAPVRADLDNGAILQWLHEDDTPSFHVRVLVPTNATNDGPGAATTTVVATALQAELVRRVRRYGGTVDLTPKPGRLEIAIHGHDEDAERIFGALTDVLSERKPARILAQAQGKAVSDHVAPDASARATSALVSILLGIDPQAERTDKQMLLDLDEGRLEHGWFTLLDPRRLVLVVHAGRPAEALTDSIAKLAGSWTGKGRHTTVPGISARLRLQAAPTLTNTRIMADPAAPLRITDQHVDGRGVVLMGRLIATPTASERAHARLVQRMLQEEMDARLLVAGDVSLFSIRVTLSKGDPAASIQRILDLLDRFSVTEHQVPRMRQAAGLWLGARVVEASLQGEDWTALWSESLDLATDDDDVVAAMARDAHAMLDADKQTIRVWQEKWIRPRGGEPGWVWVAAGVDDATLAKLREYTSVVVAD